MSSPSIRTVVARLEAIVAAYDGFGSVLTNDHDPITDLPAVRVHAGGASWLALDSRRWLITRQYELFVYVTEILKPNDDAQLLSALEDAEALLLPLATWIMQHPRLALGTLRELVHDTGEIGDGGVGILGYHKQTYSAFRLDLPVITAS